MLLPRACLSLALALAALPAAAQQAGPPPPPVESIPQQLSNLSTEPSTRMSVTFDRSQLQAAGSLIDDPSGVAKRAIAGLSSITVDTFRFQRPAFYPPENMASVVATYNAAGWKHLVNANPSPRASAEPDHPITDLWLHFNGPEIDDVAVLVRAPRTMNLIQVSGLLRPLDLVHLSGHFGIPKVDPDAVMVPAPPGR